MSVTEVHLVESEADFKACMDIRRVVFMEGQECPEDEEFDGLDDSCVHFVASVNSNVVGTCRMRKVRAFIKLERVAVLAESRMHGVGRALNEAAFAYARQNHPTLLLMAHAQNPVLDFYKRQDMIPVSDVFLECGIPHTTVILVPSRDRIPLLDIWKDSVQSSGQPCCPADESDDETVIENMKAVLKRAMQQDDCCDCLPPLRDIARLCAAQETERIIGRSLRILVDECVLATVEKRFDESVRLEKVLLDYSWEKLNTGHYSQVNDSWRLLYTAGNACKAVRCFLIGDLTTALLACDMGLLMGEAIADNCLATFATFLHTRLSSSVGRNDNVEGSSSCSSTESVLPDLSQSHLIGRDSCPSLSAFKTRYLDAESPIVITDVVSHWPACSRWSTEYLVELAGYRTVPVEIGSKYTDESWSQQLMTINQFVHRFMRQERNEIGYLAQHRLFAQIPELLTAVIVPDYCLLVSEREEDVDLNFWFGPARTVSPLHTDPRHNLLCQVMGRKFVRLISPCDNDKVYANEDGLMTNTSQVVDAEHWDETVFPLFSQARHLDCVLKAGEALFIPKGWWHYVRALDDSISVSCWFGH